MRVFEGVERSEERKEDVECCCCGSLVVGDWRHKEGSMAGPVTSLQAVGRETREGDGNWNVRGRGRAEEKRWSRRYINRCTWYYARVEEGLLGSDLGA